MGQHMPRVVALLREKRWAGEGELLNECWRRGVVGREPGWFFAVEGAVSLGVLADLALVPPELVALRQAFPDAVMLMLKGEVMNGAN